MERKPVKSSRTRPRVEDTESSKNKVFKSAQHRRSATKESNKNGLYVTSDGNVRIVTQRSELVPVAQYANVTLGPVAIEWTLAGLDLTPLLDVNSLTWDEVDEDSGEIVFDYSALTPEQKQIYEKAMAALRLSSRLLEHSLAEDRELVEASVRMRNQKDADEAKSRRR